MATTSLWHIEGRLKDLIAYVENPEKTRAENPNLQPLWDVFSYVSPPNCKTKSAGHHQPKKKPCGRKSQVLRKG